MTRFNTFKYLAASATLLETPVRNVRPELTGESDESAVFNNEAVGDVDCASTGPDLGPDPVDNSENLQRLSTNSAIELDASVDVTIQEDFLRKLRDNVSAHFPELSFAMARGVVGATEIPVLLITQQIIYFHPPYGMVSRIQVSVQYKRYTIYILMRKLPLTELRS